MRQVEGHIRDYIFWQKTKLSDICNIKIDERKHHEKVFKITLIFPLIDSMAKVYSSKNTNKDCFLDLIDNLSDWNERNLISLVHIYKFLKLISSPDLIDVERFCEEKYSKLENGHIYYSEIDIEKSLINSIWPKNQDGTNKPFLIPGQTTKFTFDNFTHMRLLYTYRNSCIHEFRFAGTDLPVSRKNLLNYINMSRDEIDFEWTLSYPIDLFIKITETIIKNLEIYLSSNSIDPYRSFEYSRYWIEGLD
jgi:hypothetical protein